MFKYNNNFRLLLYMQNNNNNQYPAFIEQYYPNDQNIRISYNSKPYGVNTLYLFKIESNGNVQGFFDVLKIKQNTKMGGLGMCAIAGGGIGSQPRGLVSIATQTSWLNPPNYNYHGDWKSRIISNSSEEKVLTQAPYNNLTYLKLPTGVNGIGLAIYNVTNQYISDTYEWQEGLGIYGGGGGAGGNAYTIYSEPTISYNSGESLTVQVEFPMIYSANIDPGQKNTSAYSIYSNIRMSNTNNEIPFSLYGKNCYDAPGGVWNNSIVTTAPINYSNHGRQRCNENEIVQYSIPNNNYKFAFARGGIGGDGSNRNVHIGLAPSSGNNIDFDNYIKEEFNNGEIQFKSGDGGTGGILANYSPTINPTSNYGGGGNGMSVYTPNVNWASEGGGYRGASNSSILPAWNNVVYLWFIHLDSPELTPGKDSYTIYPNRTITVTSNMSNNMNNYNVTGTASAYEDSGTIINGNNNQTSSSENSTFSFTYETPVNSTVLKGGDLITFGGRFVKNNETLNLDTVTSTLTIKEYNSPQLVYDNDNSISTINLKNSTGSLDVISNFNIYGDSEITGATIEGYNRISPSFVLSKSPQYGTITSTFSSNQSSPNNPVNSSLTLTYKPNSFGAINDSISFLIVDEKNKDTTNDNGRSNSLTINYTISIVKLKQIILDETEYNTVKTIYPNHSLSQIIYIQNAYNNIPVLYSIESTTNTINSSNNYIIEPSDTIEVSNSINQSTEYNNFQKFSIRPPYNTIIDGSTNIYFNVKYKVDVNDKSQITTQKLTYQMKKYSQPNATYVKNEKITEKNNTFSFVVDTIIENRENKYTFIVSADQEINSALTGYNNSTFNINEIQTVSNGTITYNIIPINNNIHDINGTTVINTNSAKIEFTYTPTLGFYGRDTFKFNIQDVSNQLITENEGKTIDIIIDFYGIKITEPPKSNYSNYYVAINNNNIVEYIKDGNRIYTIPNEYIDIVLSGVNVEYMENAPIEVRSSYNFIVDTVKETINGVTDVSNQESIFRITDGSGTLITQYPYYITNNNNNSINIRSYFQRKSLSGNTVLTYRIASKIEYRNKSDGSGFVSSDWELLKYTGLSDSSDEYTVYSQEGIISLTQQNVKIDACDTGSGPDPPRLWTRASTQCISLGGIINGKTVTSSLLDERRKAEIFKYKNNSAGFSKKQVYSRLARGINERKHTYAVQNQIYTNSNTRNLPLANTTVGPLLCFRGQRNWAYNNQNDVPGPLTKIENDPDVPLTRFNIQRTYRGGNTKWPYYGANSNITGNQFNPNTVNPNTLNIVPTTQSISTLECIKNSLLNVIYDYLTQNHKYTFNGDTVQDPNKQYGLYDGSYIFVNIPKEHPIALLNNGITNKITYIGNDTNKKFQKEIRGTTRDGSYDFYYGNITVNIYSDFGTIDLYSYSEINDIVYLYNDKLLKYDTTCRK